MTLISIHHRIIDQQQLTCQYPMTYTDNFRILSIIVVLVVSLVGNVDCVSENWCAARDSNAEASRFELLRYACSRQLRLVRTPGVEPGCQWF